MPDQYAVCAQVVGASRVSQDRLPALHWAPGPAGARCIHLGEKLRGAELARGAFNPNSNTAHGGFSFSFDTGNKEYALVLTRTHS